MVQPWAQPHSTNLNRTSVSLSYSFDVEALPSGDLFLAVEQPGKFRIALNGRAVSTDADEGWWVDTSLRRLRIDPAALCLGRNELTLDVEYDQEFSGLEMMYLLGHFGAAMHGTEVSMTALPSRLQIGDWTGQGLPFYSGHVSYHRRVQPPAPGERLFVRIGQYGGVGIRVLVDGRGPGLIAWPPNERTSPTWCAAAGSRPGDPGAGPPPQLARPAPSVSQPDGVGRSRGVS